ncbi:hypothetical protein ZHAS_00020655 [Anopheles sinensis]|uniref:Uncharacterized protein n=1 Tax=Anopheles sinensis TaxID=74873 RepID=A0A084WQB2_ANOSI|nr:hypothetical protein ZHAS_00020655 [Anopheles sinensis]
MHFPNAPTRCTHDVPHIQLPLAPPRGSNRIDRLIDRLPSSANAQAQKAQKGCSRLRKTLVVSRHACDAIRTAEKGKVRTTAEDFRIGRAREQAEGVRGHRKEKETEPKLTD